MNQAKLLDDAAALYVEIGDHDDADKAIKEAVEVAEKLYSKDTDSDDPNRAFKGAWPSTNQWRRCVQLAGHLSAFKAGEIIAGIRDPDIATFEKVYLAHSLLGTPLPPVDTSVTTKSRSSSERF